MEFNSALASESAACNVDLRLLHIPSDSIPEPQ